MFAGIYDQAPISARPKYGALNYRRRPAGGSVRFGSAHLRLKPAVLSRTTFCYPDSSTEPTHFGTAERMALVELAERDDLDVLDDHIEAHVHGPLLLHRDVDALVLDPSYRDTDVAQAATGLPFPVYWHHGFRLHLDQLAEHADYRGPDVVEAGRRIALDGWLTPLLIGQAARTGRFDEQTSNASGTGPRASAMTGTIRRPPTTWADSRTARGDGSGTRAGH